MKFLKNRLKVFKVKDLVLYLFLLKLKVIFDFTLGHINKRFKVTKTFLEKSFELTLEQMFYLTLIFILVSIEANLVIKKKYQIRQNSI